MTTRTGAISIADCKTCGAVAGTPCRSLAGEVVAAHQARCTEAARITRDANRAIRAARS